jgi:large subunit ribosomal protein L3
MRSLLAQKVEMTHIFDEKGIFIPVTLLYVDKNVVTQVKNTEKDGYEAVQVGLGTSKKVSKPLEGHLKNSETKTRKIKEISGDEGVEYKVGDEISIDIFAEGDLVDVQAITKGKGFAGTIKRHNFHRGPKTHGSHNYRAPGSIGAMFPQHVQKGQKLPGRMGASTVTTKNLKIAKIIKEENLILVRGAVPGPKKGLVLVTARKPKKEEKAE